MKKLQRRTLFVLLFILALAAGTVVLCAFYVKDGAQWASFYGNQHVYTNGRIASGSIQDRNGTTLFDCAEGQYSDDKTTRISTLVKLTVENIDEYRDKIINVNSFDFDLHSE